MFDPTQAVSLLTNIWPTTPGGWGEFRMLRTEGGALLPTFLNVPPKDKHLEVTLEWVARENQKGRNAYMGVHPRAKPRGRNEDVANYTTMVADIDRVEDSWEAITTLAQRGAPPSACVRTARGLHLYWFLKAPEPVGVENRRTMVKLQTALKSDRVHDPARILRLPGTVCWKKNNPFSIYLAWLDPHQRYTAGEIDKAVTAVWPDIDAQIKPEKPKADLKSLQASWSSSRQIPPETLAKYALPYPKGTRSEWCLSFIQTCVLHGWADADITSKLVELPIAGHYFDRGGTGLASLAYDIQKAREHVASRRGVVEEAVIERVSIVESTADVFGVLRTKLRVRLRTFGDNGAVSSTFDEWVLVPNKADPLCTERAWVRWNAFTAATCLAGSPHDWTAVAALHGRRLLVETKHDNGRQRVVWFGAAQSEDVVASL